jgi:hypothetical protein
MRATWPRIYAAHPMTTYGSSFSRVQVDRLAHLLPGAEVIDPEWAAWPTDEDWLTEWPDILPRLRG